MRTLMITFVYNELKYLPHVINYYKKNGCEIYIIDNMSNDGTYEWLVENNIPCHRIDTQEAFHVRVLEDDLIATVNRLKPDWVIFGSADLYHVTKLPISEYIEVIDARGYNQLTLPCISAIPISADELTSKTPLSENFFNALYYQPLTMISKYGKDFYLDGDTLRVENPRPYISGEGVSINYGPCKPVEEQEVKRLRTQKAWEQGMNRGYSVHYEKAKKINWVYPADRSFDLKTSPYYEYIRSINNIKPILHFDDRENWVEIRINDVKESYCVPEGISNDVCVDVGGNVGAFSMVHSKDFKRIIAIEPATYSYCEYLKNISKSGLNNVEVVQLAVADISNKTLHLKPWLFGNQSGNASTIDSEQWDENTYEEVRSISLEDIFTTFGLERINYLKIDCEGSEYDLLMNKDLSKIDYISIEIHHQLKEKAQELFHYLQDRFDIIDSHLSGGSQKQLIATLKNKLL